MNITKDYNDADLAGIEELVNVNLDQVSAGFTQFSKHTSTETCPHGDDWCV